MYRNTSPWEKFRNGARVVLKYKVGRFDPNEGTYGYVRWVDNQGYVHVKWDDPKFRDCDRMYLPAEIAVVG